MGVLHAIVWCSVHRICWVLEHIFWYRYCPTCNQTLSKASEHWSLDAACEVVAWWESLCTGWSPHRWICCQLDAMRLVGSFLYLLDGMPQRFVCRLPIKDRTTWYINIHYRWFCLLSWFSRTRRNAHWTKLTWWSLDWSFHEQIHRRSYPGELILSLWGRYHHTHQMTIPDTSCIGIEGTSPIFATRTQTFPGIEGTSPIFGGWEAWLPAAFGHQIWFASSDLPSV